MKNSNRNIWTVVLVVSLAILILLSIVSNAIEIGERLRNISVYLEIAFYAIILVVVLVGVVYPVVGVFMAPVFSLDKLKEGSDSDRQRWKKKLVKNLLENVELSDSEKEQVDSFIAPGKENDDRLIEFYDRKFKPIIDREIFDTSKKVFVITSVSQNSMIDILGMAMSNFRLVKRIIELCGFRPNNFQVMRIYLRVLSMTALAGALEEVNLEQLVEMAVEGAPGKIFGLVVASTTQGVVNAFTTIRIGIITRHYLLDADVSKTRKEIQKKAYKESYDMLRDCIANGFREKVTDPAKKIKDGIGDKVKDSALNIKAGFDEKIKDPAKKIMGLGKKKDPSDYMLTE